MGGRVQAAAEYVKSVFSATETYLLQLKGVSSAVWGVFKKSFQDGRHLQARQYRNAPSETPDVSRQNVEDENQTLLEGNGSTRSVACPMCVNACFCCYCIELLLYPLTTCTRMTTEKCGVGHSHEYQPSSPAGRMSGLFNSFWCCCARSKYIFSSLSFLLPILFVFYLFWMYYDDYMSKLLTSFEEMDARLAFAIFVMLFVTASLPLVWGYVILNMAAGYRFGVASGAFVVMVSVTIGLALTHKISQRLCAGCIMKALKWYGETELVEGILKVLDGPSGLKVIALTRLTPIPFGLQNGIFAMSSIQTKYYVAASNIGLFPTQVLNCYIGSTFRSAEEVLSRGGSVGGYTIFFFQLALGVALMGFVIRHARKELENAMKHSADKVEWGDGASEEMLTEVRVTQPVLKQPT